MSNPNAIPFRPVRGKDANIQSMSTQDGYLYMATDTRKTYLGTSTGEKILMGQDIGIYYGNKNIAPNTNGKPLDPNVQFTIFEIEGNRLPLVNDLILNIDGCFYRVKQVLTAEKVQTERLTLQGTGSGGGGSTGGGSTSSGAWAIEIGSGSYVFSSEAVEMPVSFTATYDGDLSKNAITKVSFILGKDNPTGKAFRVFAGAYQFETVHNFNLAEDRNLFGGIDAVDVTMVLQDRYGTTKYDNISIKLVALSLKAVEDALIPMSESVYNFRCNLSGATSTDDIQSKKLVYNFYREENLETSILTIEYPLNVADKGTLPKDLALASLGHGIYVLKVQAFAQINAFDSISSNIITHKVGRFTESTSPLLLAQSAGAPEQYTNIPIDYLFISSEIGKDYTLEIRVNNIFHKSLTITSNTADYYTFYFEDTGTKRVQFTILETGVSTVVELEVSKYSGQLPVIDLNRGDLQLYLNPKGKTNSDTDRDIWVDSKNGVITAELSGFGYSQLDGWMTDASGESYLKLISGAKLEVPNYYPFNTDPVKGSRANGITIELDFEVNGILDFTKTIFSCVSYTNRDEPAVGFELIGDKLKMYNSRLNGCLDAEGNLKGVLSQQTIIEGKRIKVSYVIEPSSVNFPMCYTYFNGKMSGATSFKEDDAFVDSYYKATIKVDSTYAQVKVYGIRFYNAALSEHLILNNYTASLPSLEERQRLYDSNNVYVDDNISFDLVSSKNYNLEIPYMKLTGGYKSLSKDDKWTLALPGNMKAGLPTGKKDYRLVDVEVVYPDIEYFKGYENYSFTNEYERDGVSIPMKDAGGLKPTNGGAIMYGQGTSSMEYPVKNLRLRFKKDKNWYKVRPDLAPVEIICMKADYMESSGSHNTGTANFVDDLYKSANMKTPGQQHFGGEGKDTIVTCIKGHPCLIFYSESPEGPYEYIGKYNLNLDKATPQPFGFNHDDSDFGYLNEGEPYYAVEYDDDGDAFIGQEDPAAGGDYNDTPAGEELTFVGYTKVAITADDYSANSGTYYVNTGTDSITKFELATGEFSEDIQYFTKDAETKSINSIHCFEFLDNAVKVCNFLNKKIEEPLKEEETLPTANSIYEPIENLAKEDFKANVHYIKNGDIYEPATEYVAGQTYYTVYLNYEESWYNTVWDSKEKRYAPGWTLGFESRYPEDRLGYHDADMLWPLASWLHELYCIRYGLEGHEANPDYAIARFKNEYECYLDKKFTLTYYLVTEALLMADSRVKNMMIATWAKAKKSYYPLVQSNGRWVPDTTATPVETNNYIFYPIFYDMDTMLGLDNTGAARFTYSDEDTDPAVYNGDEVLWNFVRDALPTDLITWYSQLEQGLLNASDLLPYYNKNQANMANEAFYNGDAKYKYIDKFRSGYHDDLYDKDLKPGEAPYLYAAQGDRSLMRESFINNRIRFLMGKYTSEKYQKGDRVVYRQNCPTAPAEPPVLGDNPTAQELENRSAYYVKSDGAFKFTSLKTGYAGVNLGANGGLSIKRFAGPGDVQTISIDTSSASGTEAYLLGLSTLSDLGDLSTKYMQKFIMESSDIRLEKLILGNPHRYYYNRYWNIIAGGQAPEITLGGYDAETNEPYGCLYLKEFNLQNCGSFNNTLDFRVCTAIEKILLTGSGVSGITLPENGLLTELRLPTSINKLRIVGHKSLDADHFSMGGYAYDETLPVENQKIGAGNGRYTNNFSRLSSLHIVDTPIDTYTMVREAESLETYYLRGINWTLTSVDPDAYCCRLPSWSYVDEETGEKVTLATKLQPGVQYYTLKFENDTINYLPYEGTSYPAGNAYLYEKVSMLDKDNNIVCLPVLEYLLTLNTKADDASHAEALSGTITIAVEGAKANELALYDMYKDKYPNLVIAYDTDKVEVEEANTINFYPGSADKDYVESAGGIEGLTPARYSLTAKDAHTLAELVGTFEPVKVQTTANTYSFTGSWVDWADPDKTIYYQDSLPQCSVPEGEENYKFSVFKPDKDMDLVPIFTSHIRQYVVTLYDYDGTKLTEEHLGYQTLIGEVMTSDYAHYCYREYTNESKPDYRWAFKGWQSKFDWQNGATAPTYTSLAEQVVTADIGYYAFYKEENVYDTPSMISKRDDFFTFQDISINGVAGVRINLRDKYRYLLQGKITLPATDPSGKPVLEIGNFNAKYDMNGLVLDRTKFTHIYFEMGDAGHYYKVGDYAFTTGDGTDSYSNLQVIDLPATIREIGQDAFKTNINLKTVKLNDEIITVASNAFWNCQGITSFGIQGGVPAKLVNIGIAAYYNCGPALSMTSLPSQLTYISGWAFAGSSSVNISTFGSATQPITHIGGSAFSNSGDGTVTTMTIYCASEDAVQSGAFSNYNVNISHLTIVTPENVTITDEAFASWSLKCAANVTISKEHL